MGLLEIENLSLRFNGHPILDGLTMDIWEGHIHAIIGPNGAGKSTLAYAVMGLAGYTDHAGDIRFDGRSLCAMPVDERARLGIALAWQEPARFEGLTVRQFIRAGIGDGNPDLVEDVIRQVGLDPARYLDRAVDKSLSGGERKRIEIASIMAMEPKLLIMDEPDSSIDVDALNRIFQVLRRLKQRGATVVMITHSVPVLRQAEHGFLMCDGRLIDKGDIDKVGRFFRESCVACDHPNQPEASETQADPSASPARKGPR